MGYHEEILSLISQAPPHEVIAYLCLCAEIALEETANRYSEAPLRELLEILARRLVGDSRHSSHSVLEWIAPLRKVLCCNFCDLPDTQRPLAHCRTTLESI